MNTPGLDVVLARLDAIDKRLDKVLEDHEQRLRKVERWVFAIPPTLLIAAATIIASVLKG